MVTYSVILKKEFYGVEYLKHLTLFNDFLLSHWFPIVTPHVSKPHDYVNHMFMRL
jgi:hypothetical protein